ncbi:ion transporter [Reichenbachiella carrageenanivorans]|uniref:Ion transporter n=1 Tax=Reichenbachiella carrageenanivorans TaxID=2979869 RepID=A0ABY6D5A4_9BACT|nr:ion transporter [Reichenbachiella carrageenanivorans]UXX80233.1 ion transporter [Reichenbachiella carrageenanivorans]
MDTEEYRKSPGFQNLLLILSIYVVVELYLDTILDYPENVKEALSWIDFGICMLFLFDFFNGFFRSKNKWRYFKNNWIDLISSIPTIEALRMGRIVRVIRILRVLRSAKYIFNAFSKKNSFNTFRNLMLISGMIILFFTLSFYHLERNANPHITSMSDSLWWTTVTTITVGFLQDIPPVTVEGKFLSVALILLGMIMFSTLTGTITDYFIEDEDIQVNINELKAKVESLEGKIDQMTNKIDQLNKS